MKADSDTSIPTKAVSFNAGPRAVQYFVVPKGVLAASPLKNSSKCAVVTSPPTYQHRQQEENQREPQGVRTGGAVTISRSNRCDSACPLQWNPQHLVESQTRICDQETTPVTADLKRVMREKARFGPTTFALTTDISAAYDPRDWHFVGCLVGTGFDVYIFTLGTF